MNEAQVRQKIVGIMQDWVGRKESDGSHKPIIDIYNSMTPLPRNYRMSYKDAWCAATVSAAAIKAGYTDIIPRECSCYYMIEGLKRLGRWHENDAYIPSPGDIIFYDWQDGTNYASTDNRSAPDHVGMVEQVGSGRITVIEGNYSDMVKRRTLAVNGRYIRGFGLPDYASKVVIAPGILTVGSSVQFIGTHQYANSYQDAAPVKATPCPAKITLIREGGAHPYHLSGSGVSGWVNSADVLDNGGKSTEDVAREVLLGLWGNNPTRTARLTEAGYDPAAVQKMVNALVNR